MQRTPLILLLLATGLTAQSTVYLPITGTRQLQQANLVYATSTHLMVVPNPGVHDAAYNACMFNPDTTPKPGASAMMCEIQATQAMAADEQRRVDDFITKICTELQNFSDHRCDNLMTDDNLWMIKP